MRNKLIAMAAIGLLVTGSIGFNNGYGLAEASMGAVNVSMTSVSTGNVVVPDKPVMVILNNIVLPDESGAIVRGDVIYFPLRILQDVYGYKIYWDDINKLATLEKGSDLIQVGFNNLYSKNGETLGMDNPPILVNGKMLVPLKFLSSIGDMSIKTDLLGNKVEILDKDFKSKFSQEIQQNINNKISTAIKAFDTRSSSINREYYREFNICNSLSDVNSDYFKKAVAYINVKEELEGSSVKLNKGLTVKVKTSKDDTLAPIRIEYKVGTDNQGVMIKEKKPVEIETIKDSAKDEVDKEDVGKVDEPAEGTGNTVNSEEIVKEFTETPITLVDVTDKLKLTGTEENQLFGLGNMEIVDGFRWYDSVNKNYKIDYKGYISCNNIDKGYLPNIYPFNAINSIIKDENSYIETEINVEEGSGKLDKVKYSGIIKAGFNKDFCDEMGLSTTKDYYVVIIGNNE